MVEITSKNCTYKKKEKKRNETKRNETKRNETKRNETKQKLVMDAKHQHDLVHERFLVRAIEAVVL